MTAKEMANLATQAQERNVENGYNAVMGRIKLAADSGKFELREDFIHPLVKTRLQTDGFKVDYQSNYDPRDSYDRQNQGSSYYKISWAL